MFGSPGASGYTGDLDDSVDLVAGLGRWTANQSKCEMKMVLDSGLLASAYQPLKHVHRSGTCSQALETCIVGPRNN